MPRTPEKTASNASSSLPLSGVRIFLHIRNASADTPTGGSKRNTARAMIKTLRAQAQQLGATLALSEAAADLVVFHEGSTAFLSGLHAKYKAVVHPDYLAACIAADHRVGIAPYAITSERDAAPVSDTEVAVAAAAAERRQASRKRRAPSSSLPEVRQSEKEGKGATRTSDVLPAASPPLPPPPSSSSSSEMSRRLMPLLLDEETGENVDGTPLCAKETTRTDAQAPHQSLENICSAADTSGGTRVELWPARSPSVPSQATLSDSAMSITPKLTPSSRRDVPALPPSLAAAQEMSKRRLTATTPTTTSSTTAATTGASAATERDRALTLRQGCEKEEEEMIRHAVLRSTAVTAVTRRRGRPAPASPSTATVVSSTTRGSGHDDVADGSRSPLLMDAFCTKRVTGSTKAHAPDPFLCSLKSTQNPLQQQQEPSATSLTVSCSELSSVPVTQPLATPEPQPAAQATQQRPTSRTSKPRRRVMEEIEQTQESRKKEAAKRQKVEAASPVARPSPHSADKCNRDRKAHAKKKRPRASTPVPNAEDRVLEPPLSMTFSEVSLLRRLPDGDAADVCVRFFVEDEDDVGEYAEDNTHCTTSSVPPLTFLRDVVEQLGATVVDDDGGGGGGGGGAARWFGRSAARGRTFTEHGRRMRTTHLVVSPHAVLTPDLLYYKARGIPIVTPQWVYDAVALGGFPCVVPHLHAHPIFGDSTEATARAGAAAAVAEDTHEPVIASGFVLGDVENGLTDKVSTLSSHLSKSVATATRAADARANSLLTSPAPLPHSTSDLSSTLRQLHKEVAEEYVPAGEQAWRPYYRPIFQDCMLYLYVPPIDLAAATRKRANAHTGKWSYLGDVTAALEQATELLRLLGGTVTRNLASTYLDVVVDLTGFYERTIEAGQQQQQQQQRRLVRESLSCAYHDALQRLSQVPAMFAEVRESNAGVRPLEAGAYGLRSGPPPIVGISWLLYSILQRQRADVTPFAIANHPLSTQLAAAHTEGSPPADVGVRLEAPVQTDALVDGVHNRATYTAALAAVELVPTPTFSSTSTTSSVPSCSGIDSPPSPPSSPSRVSRASSSSPWPSVSEGPPLKRLRGPAAAQKDSRHQLNTQEIAALLKSPEDNSSSMVGVPIVAEHTSKTAQSCVRDQMEAKMHSHPHHSEALRADSDCDLSLWGHVEYSDDDDSANPSR